MSKNDGGPAFPAIWYDRDSTGAFVPRETHLGMTLRDYFAAEALVHLYTHGDDTNSDANKAAAWAYQLADAMLAEREK